jgi:hypothetical protein
MLDTSKPCGLPMTNNFHWDRTEEHAFTPSDISFEINFQEACAYIRFLIDKQFLFATDNPPKFK